MATSIVNYKDISVSERDPIGQNDNMTLINSLFIQKFNNEFI